MNKIKSGLLLAAIFALVLCDGASAEDVLNPNYGTTTFFSEKSEKPSDKPPVYDVGVKAGKELPKDDDGDSGADKDDEGLFNQIIGGIEGFFNGTANTTTDSTEKSLFDLQENSGNENDSSFSDDGEFVMGARGESLENLDDEEAAKYASRISSGFNFRDNGSGTAPKKSKLLFTNIIIPVNLTTQYVLVGFVFFVSIGLAVGYYLWKKEETKDKKKYSEEDYQ